MCHGIDSDIKADKIGSLIDFRNDPCIFSLFMAFPEVIFIDIGCRTLCIHFYNDLVNRACFHLIDHDQHQITYLEFFSGIYHPLPGHVPGPDRYFYTKDFQADCFGSYRDHPCFYDPAFIEHWFFCIFPKVKSLSLFKHCIFSGCYNAPSLVIQIFDDEINITAEHVVSNTDLTV